MGDPVFDPSQPSAVDAPAGDAPTFDQSQPFQVVSRPEPSTFIRVNNAVGQGITNTVNAMGSAISDAFHEDQFSGEVVQSLRDAKVFGPAQYDQRSIMQNFNEAILKPAINAAELAARTGNAAFGAYQAGMERAGEEVGAPKLGRDLAAMPEAFFGGGHPTMVHVPSIVAETETARRLRVIDEGAGSHLGEAPTQPPAPLTMDEARQAPVIAPEEPPAAQAAPAIAEDAAPKPDVHQIARQVDPETFTKYDALVQRQDQYRDWLDDLSQKREDAARTNAPKIQEIGQQLADLEGQDGFHGKRQSLVTRRDALIAEDDAAAAEAAKTDTQDMALVRTALRDNDYQMRDFAPQVSAAYREAESRMPPAEEAPAPSTAHQVPEAAETAAPKVEQAEAASGDQVAGQSAEPTPARAVTTPEHVQAIVDDVSQKLTKANRPTEEANAAAEVVAAQYQARAERFEGAKGTALDLYHADAPAVRAKDAGGPKGLAQGALNKAKSVVTLFKSADASTFMHEMGHKWLSDLMSDAKDDAAPQEIKDMAATTLQWLGVDKPEDVTRHHEEKWARGFERHLYDGQAPSPGLAKAYGQFRSWLTAIYDRVKGLAPISDDIRDVFDRLLARNPERQPAAKTEPAGKMLADVHEADAEHAPPAYAAAALEQVQGERDKLIEKTIPELTEVAHGRAGETVEGTAGLDGAGGVPAEAGAGRGVAEHHAVNEGDDHASAKGSVVRGDAGEPGRRVNGDDAAPDSVAGPVQADGATGDELKAGNIRLGKYQDTPEGLRQYIKDVANENGGFFSARRGKLTMGEIIDLANDLGMDPHQLDGWKIGQAFNAEEILAARQELRRRTDIVTKLMSAEPTEKNALAFAGARADQLMAQEVLSGVTAEWGRGGSAFKVKIGDENAKDVSAFLKENSGLTLYQIQEMMQRGQGLKDPAQVNKFLRNSQNPDFGDRVMFYYQNCLLSGPITHARYGVGNIVNAIVRPLVEVPMQATAGVIRQALTGEERTVYYGEAREQLAALGKGALDGMKAAKTAWETGQSPLLPGERGHGQWADRSTNPIPGTVGQIIGYPMKSVAAIHSLFKSIGYAQNTAALAFRTATREGLTGADFDRRVAQLSLEPTAEMRDAITGELDPTKMDPEHYAAALDASAETMRQLYMEPTKFGTFMDHLGRASNANMVAKMVVPFMKIGANITKQAMLERTPLGFADKDIRGNLLGDNGPLAADMQRGKVAFGTTMIAGIATMVAQGLATGDGPTDPTQRAEWLLTHKPNTIQIGHITIPYQGLGYLGMLLRFGANMAETAHGWNEKEGGELALSFLEGTTKAVVDENFMRGLHDLTDAMYHPQEYGMNYIRSFATNFLPYSVGLGQVAREIDPTKRTIDDPTFANAYGIFDTARQKIPYPLPGNSTTLFPRRDMFGEEMQNGGASGLYANDPVVNQLDALQLGIGKLSKEVRGVHLTAGEYDDYARIAGRLTKIRLDQLVRAPNWSAVPDFAKIETIHKIVENSRKAAGAQLWAENPQLLQRANADKQADLEQRQTDLAAVGR